MILLGQEGWAASTLQWGRPQTVAKNAVHAASINRVPRPVKQLQRIRLVPKTAVSKTIGSKNAVALVPKNTMPIRRDSYVMAAAWEEDDARDRSVVVDPFDEEDRLAQLDDPFDEPVDERIEDSELLDVIEDLNADDINSVEDAIEEEINRRNAFDDLDEETESSLDDDPFEKSLDEELDEMKPLLEELEADLEDDEDTLQPGKKPEGYDKFPGRRKNRNLPRLDLDTDDNDDEEDGDGDNDDDDEEEGLTPEELEEQRKELAKERRESEESCQENLQKIESSRISSIDLRIRVDGNAGEDFPYECPASTQTLEPRQWPQITYTWKAACLCHKPLYFEQVQLERYGHSWGPYVQPILSGVHFFGTLPILPYKMGIRTPRECVYTLGYYRPGSCAPYMIDPVPFTWRAMMFQGVATTGISFIIP